MQRWSIGHSRHRQGLHSTGSRTTRLDELVGPVATSSVAPKTATVGTFSAAATCIAPESFVRNSSQAAASSTNLAILTDPAKFTHAIPAASIACCTTAQTCSSPWEPKTATEAFCSRAMRTAASAKRSGSHRFAPPYAAPGLTPITGPCMERAANCFRPSALRSLRSRQANRRFQRIACNELGAFQELEVIKPLVRRRLAAHGNGNRPTQ